MKFLVHGIHVALVLGGAVAICSLTSPGLSRGWRMRRMRAAARSGRLVELAAARIRDAGMFRHVPRPPAVWVLLAYSFALACTGTALLTARLAGAPWPDWPVIAGTATLSWLVGAWLLRTRRRPRRVALATIVLEIALHPVVVVATEFAAYRRAGSLSSAFASALFCHRVGQAPSTTQVAAAAQNFGLHVPVTPAVSPGGFLSPTATAAAMALLAVGGLFAHWLCLDQPRRLPGRADQPVDLRELVAAA